MSILRHFFKRGGVVFIAAAGVFGAWHAAFADWQKEDTSIAWKAGGQILWRFCYDPDKGKVYFDPLATPGNPSLTNFKPQDHPWHYANWFSWKYINHVNYWEEDPKTGNSVGNTFGKTRWAPPTIDTHPDGSAVIKLDLTYVDDKGVVVMSEQREIEVSAPAADGSYHMDWRMHFTAGKQDAVLDRTAMMGEPQGAINGGYAGLSIRLAAQPLLMKVMTPAGAITEFPSSRARPNSPCVACNFVTKEGKNQGGVAIFSDPKNLREDAPWYIINDDTQNNGEGFRFVDEALLAPKPLTVKAGETMDLHYRVAMSPKAWTAEELKAGQAAFMKK